MPRKPTDDDQDTMNLLNEDNNAVDNSNEEMLQPTRQVWAYRHFGDHFVVLVDNEGNVISSSVTTPTYDDAMTLYNTLEPWSSDIAIAAWIDANKQWFTVVYSGDDGNVGDTV